MIDKEYYLFDLDGTIIDSSESINNSIKYALNYYNEPDNSFNVHDFIGPPLMDSFQKYFGFTAEKSSKMINKYREYFTKNGIKQNKLYDGISDIIKELSAQGKKNYLATSKPEIYAKTILENLNLADFFCDICGATLDGIISKKIDVINLCVTRNGIKDKENAVMIGDTHFDMQAAECLGIDSIGVVYGFGSKDELISSNATYIADNTIELKKLLI